MKLVASMIMSDGVKSWPIMKTFDLTQPLSDVWEWAVLVDSNQVSFNVPELLECPINSKLTLQCLLED